VSGCRASKDHNVFILTSENEEIVIPQHAEGNSANNITSLKTCIFRLSLERPWRKQIAEKTKDKQKQVISFIHWIQQDD
jgi:hypothetical protein